MAASSTAADQLSKKVGQLGGSIAGMVSIAKGVVLYEAIKGAFDAFAGLNKFNVDMANTTAILQGNAQAASTWLAVSDLMAISVESLDRSFVHLSSVMNSGGNPALKQMGINAEDAHGKLKLINQVVLESADYFQRHAGASNNAALANELFGRSGYELVPILEMGRKGLADVAAEASKYGLILDSAAIKRNAAFTYQLKLAGLAAKGLAISVGNAVLPAITTLAMALAKVVQSNLPAFIAGIVRAVNYIAGFIEGLTGVKLTLDPLALKLAAATGAIDDTGTAMDKGTSAADRLAAAIQKVRDRTTAATRAIDDQIKKLNAQNDAQSFMDRQAKLQQDLANKSKDIEKLRREQYTQFWLGNFATARDIGDQITRAQEDAANLTTEMTRNTEDEQTKAKITALEKQKQFIQDAADKQIAAMQRAAKGTTDAMTGAFGAITKSAGRGGSDSAANFMKLFNPDATGRLMGEKLLDALLGPLVSSGAGGKVHTSVRKGANWIKVGQAIGDAIGTGITISVGASISKYFEDLAAYFKKSPTQRYFEEHPPKGYASGGTVPGPLGAPQLAIVHGGERVLTPQQQLVMPSDGDDLGETNALLRDIARSLQLMATPPSSTGLSADVTRMLEHVSHSRRRGLAGV
jgi:hypothetical protein